MAVRTRYQERRSTVEALAIAAKSGDERARDQLVGGLLPQIRGAARAYRRSPVVDEVELTQEGVVGVLRALERFDPARGTPFWAYAAWWVRQAMQQLISELTGAVVLSDRAVRQLARIKRARRECVQTLGHEPTTRQLAAKTGLSTEQVDNLVVAERRPRGLEERIGGPLGDSATFREMLADPRGEDDYESVPRGIEVEELPRLFSELSERERQIVSARFGLDGPEQTLRQLGSDLGVSAERVRQIEERGLGKLRAAAQVAA